MKHQTNFLYQNKRPELSTLREQVNNYYHIEEDACVAQLIEYFDYPQDSKNRIEAQAQTIIVNMRKKRLQVEGIDAFMNQYQLSSEEGIALLCLAEALLRIPDKKSQDKLIKDKLAHANWRGHAGKSHSLFVNAATGGLILTGQFYHWQQLPKSRLAKSLMQVVNRVGSVCIRQASNYAMRILGKQFVMGANINQALMRAKSNENIGYNYSYDMLGEAAQTASDAEQYFKSYEDAIHNIGTQTHGKGPEAGPGISVKLSALHPRYEFAKYDEMMDVLFPRVLALAKIAKQYNIGFTIDAEEARRLDLSLDIIEQLLRSQELVGWQGLGLALQAYQKRAFWVIDWLAELAKQTQHKIRLRLVKGAYWDSEIKFAQESGLQSYPVFTRKMSTDLSYLACAKKIIDYGSLFYPQFATHNAHTVSVILELMKDQVQAYEFQCLHGMGQLLYDDLLAAGYQQKKIACRIYAPVGGHKELLPYLVRRLLENGANNSFVNRISDPDESIEHLLADPKETLLTLNRKYHHPNIRLPGCLFGDERKNSRGLDMTDQETLKILQTEMEEAFQTDWRGGAIINGQLLTENTRSVCNPADTSSVVGEVSTASSSQVEQALCSAFSAFKNWSETPVDKRASFLERAADLLEKKMSFFMAVAIKEAGKSVNDALAEVREAIDFCRYYAAQARKTLTPVKLVGPTGETNELSLYGRGVMVCISPWNFPLAIFMGQVTAALVAGNCVLAKPSEQTVLIASYAVKLLHEAGVPAEVLQLIPGPGKEIGQILFPDLRVGGVMFTGSSETAYIINQALAQRRGPIVPFIAETGGQNAMIVDSSALPEQVVVDVIQSAFGSAGQRCSALRVLFVQEDILDKILTMLTGAMAELKVGDPALLETDVGPLIDSAALATLEGHLTKWKENLLYQVAIHEDQAQKGTFFAPCLVKIDHINQLETEVFGPFLHVVSYKESELEQVVDMINGTNYGLTLGIHSRIQSMIDKICQKAHVGNVYVNRNMIGAVVGVQPFGGEGLSGTGPKAGGPNYLVRLCHERTKTVNTTAAGGNASLMSLAD